MGTERKNTMNHIIGLLKDKHYIVDLLKAPPDEETNKTEKEK